MKYRLFDNQGETVDRYTVVYDELATNDKVQFLGRGMSEDPTTGIGATCTVWMKDGFNGDAVHLGKEIKLDDAPIKVQQVVKGDLKDYE